MRLSFISIFGVLLLSFALCSAIFQISNETIVELSEEDRDALEDYFKLMLTESEGGYVLLGVKPVCVEGVYAVLPCTKLNIFQKSSAYRSERLRQGIETWTRLFSSQDGPIQIVYYDQPDRVFPEWQHVVWLNRKAVLEVVESNLSLFQLVLGPQATSKEVLNRLSDRKESFSSVLANHKVLVGIVLGFGTRNCLAQSRREVIEEGMCQQECLPLVPRYLREGMSSPLDIGGMEGVVFGTKPPTTSEVIPNFGFKRLCEEHVALNDQLAISTTAYRNLVPPIPTFAYLKDDPQELQLLESYVKAQEKISRLLVSPSFLEDVLDLITGRKVRLIVTSSGKDLSKRHPGLNSPIESIRGKARDFGANGAENTVAHSIWNNLLEKDSAYIAAVVHGIRAAARAKLKLEDGDPSSRPEQVQPILTYLRERGYRKTKINLQKSEEALSHYASIPESREVIPQKLYYRLVQQGQGDELKAEHANVQIHHTISLLDLAAKDQAISIACFKTFGIKDLIPGLRYGMYGMRVGEVREIYIHPDYAYGLRSNFEPGLGLRIRVELVSLGASLAETPPLGKCPFIDDCHALLPPMISEEEFRKLKQAAGFAEGFNAWSFLRNIEDLFTIEGVITSLQQQSKFSHPPEHQHAEKEFLQKLHILLYKSVISNGEIMNRSKSVRSIGQIE